MAGNAFARYDPDPVLIRPPGTVAAPSPRWSRSRLARFGLAVLAGLLASLVLSDVAAADPDENHDQTLLGALEAAARGYYESQAVLAASQQRQAEIEQNLQISEAALVQLTQRIGRVAAARYKGSSVGLFTGLLNGQASAPELLGGAAVGEYLLWKDDTYIRQYRVLKEESLAQRELLAAEVAIQTKQNQLFDQQKREAERALAAAGGMITAGFVGPDQPAQPALRNADGSLPWESCSDPDPTTSGCLTPRTVHMLYEAQAAGFNRYTACYRGGTWGEHPAGRACDFSAFPSGFPSYAAGGEDKAYGDALASWAVANANALGVLYVIWYRQVWFPGSGWRGYSGYGDAATEHTNHVHVSMY
jgi:hypothetical protein